MQEFISFLNTIHPLSDGCQKYLWDTIKIKHLKKGEMFLHAGKVSNELCFITSGLLKSYYMEREKEIVSSWFMKEGDFVISVRSFFSRTPSIENIQALEKTSLFTITYDELQKGYLDFLEFNVVGRLLLEKYYSKEVEKNYILKLENASEKYAYLVEYFPWMIHRISNKNIASFLGISEHRLSHIKSPGFSRTAIG